MRLLWNRWVERRTGHGSQDKLGLQKCWVKKLGNHNALHYPSEHRSDGYIGLKSERQPGVAVLGTGHIEACFIRSTDVEGVPKIRNSARTPGHAHFGANLWSACTNSPGSTCTPNLKSVASSDTEILRGSRNFEIGHVPQATPTLGPICGLRARTAQNSRAHQI